MNTNALIFGQCHAYIFFGREKSHFSIQTLKEVNINQCTNGQHRNGVIFKKVTGLLIHPSSLTAIGMNENEHFYT